ncbi:hypothetical protein GOP47_0006533 [Adiantum capillus-veneris]|uniref:Uncharacterized protein n=1 Tax=Adiantum capillus-veneris TaxID=13818 RepID=A0A9D4ZM51_ADICA|nr:hypothetical protein GOP47_0006533 [Adiantum capillus-veneris]
MCNLQGLSRSSSIALLHDQDINAYHTTSTATTDPLTAAEEPSSACLWAMVNDYLELESTSAPKDGANAISQSGLLVGSSTSARFSAAAATVLDRAIQEMGSILESRSASAGDQEERIANCVTAALNAEAFTAGQLVTELCTLPSMLRCLQGEAYNAALCMTERKILSTTRSSLPPTGGHKYIDVIMGEETSQASLIGQKSSDQRVIVDVGFRAHFEIARPLPAYQKLIAMLPSIFIGKADLLQRVVRIMCQAARASLECQDMPIPPWRSFSFLHAKWVSSSCTRISSLEEATHVVLNGTSPSGSCGKTRICAGRNCGSDPANVTHSTSDWAACSNASKRFPSQGDGMQVARLFWHTSPATAQIFPADQNNQNNDDERMCGIQKRRDQSNVVSALAMALAQTQCTHMLPKRVASNVVRAQISRPQSSVAGAVL